MDTHRCQHYRVRPPANAEKSRRTQVLPIRPQWRLAPQAWMTSCCQNSQTRTPAMSSASAGRELSPIDEFHLHRSATQHRRSLKQSALAAIMAAPSACIPGIVGVLLHCECRRLVARRCYHLHRHAGFEGDRREYAGGRGVESAVDQIATRRSGLGERVGMDRCPVCVEDGSIVVVGSPLSRSCR